MLETKIQPYEGKDGRLYFNYPHGAEYLFKPISGRWFSYIILDCEYVNETEYYKIASAGKELPQKYTAENLKFLMQWFDHEEVENGAQLVELPLLAEEVRQYYSDKRSELNKLNAEYNAKLKETNYFKVGSLLSALKRPLELASANKETGKLSELEQKKAKYEAERAGILKALSIDEKILKKIPACSKCYDTGFDNGEICECAYEQQEIIKEYNALRRLSDRTRIAEEKGR